MEGKCNFYVSTSFAIAMSSATTSFVILLLFIPTLLLFAVFLWDFVLNSKSIFSLKVLFHNLKIEIMIHKSINCTLKQKCPISTLNLPQIYRTKKEAKTNSSAIATFTAIS